MTAENFRPTPETEQEAKNDLPKEEQTGTEELLAALEIPTTSLLEGWRDNYLPSLLKIRTALKEEIAKMSEGKRKETKKLELGELEEDIRQVQAGVVSLEKQIEKEKQRE